jgi:hypothetical protein
LKAERKLKANERIKLSPEIILSSLARSNFPVSQLFALLLKEQKKKERN